MSTQPNLGMPVTTFENPMGIDGFEFVEFAAPAGQAHLLHDYFRKLGFSQVARHKTRPISTYRQGDCTFLINEDPDSFAAVSYSHLDVYKRQPSGWPAMRWR